LGEGRLSFSWGVKGCIISTKTLPPLPKKGKTIHKKKRGINVMIRFHLTRALTIKGGTTSKKVQALQENLYLKTPDHQGNRFRSLLHVLKRGGGVARLVQRGVYSGGDEGVDIVLFCKIKPGGLWLLWGGGCLLREGPLGLFSLCVIWAKC